MSPCCRYGKFNAEKDGDGMCGSLKNCVDVNVLSPNRVFKLAQFHAQQLTGSVVYTATEYVQNGPINI